MVTAFGHKEICHQKLKTTLFLINHKSPRVAPPTMSGFTYFATLTFLTVTKTSYHGTLTEPQLSFTLIYRQPIKHSILDPYS